VSIATAVLLALACVFALISLAGVASARGPYDKLHFLAPAAIFSSAFIAAALIVNEKLNARGLKGLVVFAAFFVLNPILVHATARAARLRASGDWRTARGRSKVAVGEAAAAKSKPRRTKR
jgi:multisubunit Na+/H+ antiporter MnhG subunit